MYSTKVFQSAVVALDNIFFVGIQEEYEVSVAVMLRELNVTINASLTKERNQQKSKSVQRQKASIRDDGRLQDRMKEVNFYDLQLYNIGERADEFYSRQKSK